MTTDTLPPVHALIPVVDRECLKWDAGPPDWMRESFSRAPWVVVRRATALDQECPVGIRGSLRSERSAAWLPRLCIDRWVTPQNLADRKAWQQVAGAGKQPWVAALEAAARLFADHGHAGLWGPAGSVGFELACGIGSTTPESDLDLILKADTSLRRSESSQLHARLSTLDVRVDLLLETPLGAVSMSEFASGSPKMLLRSILGRHWVSDPWAEVPSANAA